MKALQSVSNSHHEYLLGFRSKKQRARVTLFRDSKYIRQLNHVLSLELGTLALYRKSSSVKHLDLLEQCIENHVDSSKQLRNLIVANRGIPDCDALALPTELSILAGKLGFQFGESIGSATSLKLCQNLEQLLRKRYLELLKHAPLRDRSQLQALLLQTKANTIALDKAKF